MMDAFDIRNM